MALERKKEMYEYCLFLPFFFFNFKDSDLHMLLTLRHS